MSNATPKKDNQNILPWVNVLPEIEGNLKEKLFLIVHRDQVISLVDRADELTAQAAELRAEAYRKSLNLESKARVNWTEEQIQSAKKGVGR